MKLVWVLSILTAQAVSTVAYAAQKSPHAAPPAEMMDGSAQEPMNLHQHATPAHSQSRYEQKQRGCRAIPIPDECLN